MDAPILDTDLLGFNHETAAIERLCEFEPEDGYYLAFSGGKDSVVLLDLAKRAGVKYDAHYNNTTVDPPELVRFIRKTFPEVEMHHPKESMYALIKRNGLPMRLRRWCCRFLKEGGGDGRTVLTGVRAAESPRRAHNRKIVEFWKGRHGVINPILDWTDAEVWRYIRGRRLEVCSLYSEGYKRLGCVLCPFASPAEKEVNAKRWPGIARAYVRSLRYYLGQREGKQAEDAEAMFAWWMTGEGRYSAKEVDGQCELFQ